MRGGGGGLGVGCLFRVIVLSDNFFQSLDFLYCLLNISHVSKS